MGTPPVRPRIRSRRIVERPRLVHLLDRSRARIRTLVAGPGYGKTVLLEQWAPRDGRRVGWYRARRSAADVAVVARGIQAAAAPILPDAGRRMLERLSVTEDPEREAVLLGEMLAEDLVGWPDDAWLVIDDYQHLTVAEGPERFVEVLATRSPVQLALASRERPLWVHAKALLYGDVLEITQAMLAMTTEEAEEVLEGGQLDLSSGLLTLADGWPAVIGLAGMAPEVTEIDADMPETLYAFFADEVYRGLDPGLAEALGILAAMPTVDRELAAVLLGTERALQVCDEALALGILDDRDGRLELHPLAAAFMEHDSRSVGPELLQAYVDRRDWDSAIEVVRQLHLDPELPSLLRPAIDDLAGTGRLRGAAELLTLARRTGVASPEMSLAEAEVSLRQGRHLTALTTARALVSRGLDASRDIGFRTLLAGARAAHIGSLEEEALKFYEDAARHAPDDGAARQARWGQLMCLSALERQQALELLAELQATALIDDPTDMVRTVDKQFSVGFRFGRVHDVSDGHRVAELVPQVEDPMVRCSFRSMFSWGLALAAHYSESKKQAELLIADASEYRLDPALPYGFSTLAVALGGLREYEGALSAVEESARRATRIHDENGIQNAYAIRTRLLLQIGEVAEACATEPPNLVRALRSMRGEVLGSRALALASLGRIQEARTLSHEARTCTAGVEAQQLAAATEAVIALKTRSHGVPEACAEALQHAFDCGAVDLLVTAYRCNHDLLSALLVLPTVRELAVFLLRRAGDEDLSRDVGGGPPPQLLDPASNLTPREREVHDLVCQGLSNSEVAALLFIAESTVKLHLRRVFRKCEVSSRAALIHNARRQLSGIDGGAS